jgi:integrase
MIARINREHLGDRPNPASAPPVRKALETMRKAYAKRNAASPRQMPALTVEPLHALLRVLEADLADPHDRWRYQRALRDRALLLFAFNSGGRRRSEVTAALKERLKVKRDGTYKYIMGATKTTRGPEDEEERERPVKGQAAKAMKAWLEEARIKEGPLFPRIARNGTITTDALAPESVRNLIVRLSAAAKVDTPYSAHSLRSGYMTEASNRGIPLAEAMGFSGHRSHDSAMRYYRSTKKDDSPAADLFE